MRRFTFGPAEIDRLRERLAADSMPHQRPWLESRDRPLRMVLKDRQVGATWYFAREAVLKGLATGRDQMIISTSDAMARIFWTYAVDFVADVLGFEPKGAALRLHRQSGRTVTLWFVGASTARALTDDGEDRYYDEFLWRPYFEWPARQPGRRITWLSYPAPYGHPGYLLWAAGREPTEDALRAGVLGEDGVWRHRVTREDAMATGCDLFPGTRHPDDSAPRDWAYVDKVSRSRRLLSSPPRQQGALV